MVSKDCVRIISFNISMFSIVVYKGIHRTYFVFNNGPVSNRDISVTCIMIQMTCYKIHRSHHNTWGPLNKSHTATCDNSRKRKIPRMHSSSWRTNWRFIVDFCCLFWSYIVSHPCIIIIQCWLKNEHMKMYILSSVRWCLLWLLPFMQYVGLCVIS